MAVPKYRITNEESGSFGANAFVESGPATLLMDADAWLITPGSTIVLDGGSWTATINGKVTSSNFSGSGGNTAIYLYGPLASLTLGATAEITAYTTGIYSEGGDTNITNKGRIVSQSPTGFGIHQHDTGKNFTINNSGEIIAAFRGIDISGDFGASGGTHTIVNSGSIEASTAIQNLSATGIEKVTNSGQITGKIDLGGGNDSFTNTGGVIGDFYFGDGNDRFTNTGTVIGVVNLVFGIGLVDFGTGDDKFTNGGVVNASVNLGEGDDVFTNFAMVTVNGTTVRKDGVIEGSIDLGPGDDKFIGGNKAEVVHDGLGKDIYKLGGGNDTYIALFQNAVLVNDTQDFVDGGAGRDTYIADAAPGGTTVINLDKKAQGGFAANLASVLTDHSLDERIFNFEDVIGSDGADIIYGTAGANYLKGNSGNDHIYGLGGNDVLEGDLGADHLYGGAGRDILTGGDLNDTFHFLALSDSGVTPKTRDLITDFASGTGTERIDLSKIDAIKGNANPNDNFTFIHESKWGGIAGELRYVWTANQTFVEADVNGDKKADFSIALDGHHTLTVSDFIGAVNGTPAPAPGGPLNLSPPYHITNEHSGNYGTVAFDATGPGKLVMDADAFLISSDNTILMRGGPWTATINGKVTSSDFAGGGFAAIEIGTNLSLTPGSSLTVGATGEITGDSAVLGFSPINVTNKGSIVATGTFGSAIRYGLSGDCTINNSGTIISNYLGIGFSSIRGSGTHTIINSGLIEALTAIENLFDNGGFERITNSGQITGKIDLGGGNDSFTNTGGVLGDFYFGDGNDSFTNKGTVTGVVDLGGDSGDTGLVDFGAGKDKFTNGGVVSASVNLGEGDDVFTNFVKVKVNGKTVQKHGLVTGDIYLGFGNDTFNGGNKAEVVNDSLGKDIYKLGGGNDSYHSMHYLPGIFVPDGQDFVDGGAGRDTYYGSLGGGVTLINIDSKAHDGFAANLASVLNDPSAYERIFNFEDVIGSEGAEIIYGTGAVNHLSGGGGNDSLYGLGGNDVLDGDFGDDHLYGGAGRDVMTGGDNEGPGGGTGSAADTFHFLSVTDSGVTAKTRDVITDFNKLGGNFDRLDLSAIDAIKGNANPNDDFTFIDQSKWGGHAGELRYVWTATQTIVEADVNGDKKADFSVALDGHHTLTIADFVGLV